MTKMESTRAPPSPGRLQPRTLCRWLSPQPSAWGISAMSCLMVLPGVTSLPRRTSEKWEGWPGGLLKTVAPKVDVQSALGQG